AGDDDHIVPQLGGPPVLELRAPQAEVVLHVEPPLRPVVLPVVAAELALVVPVPLALLGLVPVVPPGGHRSPGDRGPAAEHGRDQSNPLSAESPAVRSPPAPEA